MARTSTATRAGTNDSTTETPATQLPTPDPALARLNRLIGTWTATGRILGAPDDNIQGTIRFDWLPGGFFLRQQLELDFAALPIRSLELIGYDPASGAFRSHVYSSLVGIVSSYRWDIRDDVMTIAIEGASFRGRFSPDGESFAGGWRPDPGAEGPGNVAYDIAGTRVI